MDLTVVDVTGIPGVRVGDEAAFVGRQGRAEIRAEEMAGLANSVAYEVLCLTGRLNPREYR
jgi:alanine racemase